MSVIAVGLKFLSQIAEVWQLINNGNVCNTGISMKPIRQGDVLLISSESFEGEKLNHLTLATGEVTGHKHCITEGQAELYEKDGTLYLSVISDVALLTHDEHKAISIPHGNWIVQMQREYEPKRWKYVAD